LEALKIADSKTEIHGAMKALITGSDIGAG
jgi:hypothetical protein